MTAIRIGVIGLGKIADDQHLPAIAANPRFELVATVARSRAASDLNFNNHCDMLGSLDSLDAVAITTPPGPRYAIARDCIEAGLHVLLEKPPTATLAEIEDLSERAASRGVTLFTTWHAQHNAAVARAAELLHGRRVERMTITWHENVEKWHPGQRWIWEAGGFGVFDPGINAFSIASTIFPGSLFVREAELLVPGWGGHPDRGPNSLRQPGQPWAARMQPRLAPDRGRGMDHRARDRRWHFAHAHQWRCALAGRR